jgi:hypothetical protein
MGFHKEMPLSSFSSDCLTKHICASEPELFHQRMPTVDMCDTETGWTRFEHDKRFVVTEAQDKMGHLHDSRTSLL